MSYLLTITIPNVHVQGYGTLSGIDLQTVRAVEDTLQLHGGRQLRPCNMSSTGASLQFLFMARGHAEQCATMLKLEHSSIRCLCGPYLTGAMT